jgi:hypothetical protein
LLDALEGLAVDHRADVGGQFGRVAHHQFPGRPLDHFDHRVRNAFVQAQQAQRRTALAGGAESALHHGIRHLLGQRGAVHHHGVDAAGLGDQRHDGAVFRGQRAVDDAGHLGGAGEHHAGDARQGNQRRAHGLARAVHELHRIHRHTGCVQQLDGLPGHAGRLLGGLGQHGVARGQRGRHLAHEDGQRKVPRADADPDAARGQAQFVALAGRTGQCNGCQDALGLIGVVAQEIHRLAHFGHRIAPGLEGLLDQQRAEPGQLLLQRIGGATQGVCALAHGPFAPLLIAHLRHLTMG